MNTLIIDAQSVPTLYRSIRLVSVMVFPFLLIAFIGLYRVDPSLYVFQLREDRLIEWTYTTTAVPLIGAPSAALTWDAIDWRTAEKQVRRLQMRIAKATPGGAPGQGESLAVAPHGQRNRVRRLALERLERRVGKLSRTILRGGSGHEVSPLPGSSSSYL